MESISRTYPSTLKPIAINSVMLNVTLPNVKLHLQIVTKNRGRYGKS